MSGSAVSEETFEREVLASERPVIVDFWAPWCGPCLAVAQVLDEIAAERAGELKVVKVNVAEEPGLAVRFGISSIPTIVLFQGGIPVAGTVGSRGKTHLEKALGLPPRETQPTHAGAGICASSSRVSRDSARRGPPDARPNPVRRQAGPREHDDQSRQPSRSPGDPQPGGRDLEAEATARGGLRSPGEREARTRLRRRSPRSPRPGRARLPATSRSEDSRSPRGRIETLLTGRRRTSDPEIVNLRRLDGYRTEQRP